MKFKLLVNGNNLSLVKDFFGYTGQYFDCISTTDVIKDMTAHFQLFNPDAFLCFVDSAYDGTVEQILRLRTCPEYNSAPIVIVSKEETIEELESEGFENFADLTLVRPISSDNIVLSILRFIEEEKVKAALANSTEEIPEEPQPEPNKKKHILVVDDDRNMLKLLKNALEEKYEVTATLNGLLVEKILASKPIDLIILDYEMPIMTGADVYRKLKENEDYAKIPVCFLTGVSERSKVEEIMSLKPNGYLLKPIDMEMLMAAIANLTNT
ncbi:MAG: response regulator [Oscillospiraceae bacterium]